MNFKRNNFFLFGFLLISILNLLGNGLDIGILSKISKPILIPLLAGYFYLSLTNDQRRKSSLVFLALFLSWLGDVLLMIHSAFLFGLGAFLSAHICYIIVFSRFKFSDGGSRSTFVRRLFWTLALIFFSGTFYSIIFDGLILVGVEVPVLAYTIVITLMGIFAARRNGFTSLYSYSFVLAGALFFIISDSMIAISRFITSFPYDGFLIMLTYLTAQYLIVQGLILHIRVDQAETA
jgi:uncharacterized membrane protein YhhN